MRDTRCTKLLVVFILSLIMCGTAYSEDKAVEEEVHAGIAEMHISDPVFHFGTVMQGTPVKHDFEIRNDGTAPLKIRQIEAGCGCTVVTPEKREILPGETGKIAAEFDTTGFHGYKVRTIRVYTNDPKQSSKVLSFEGTVKTDVFVDPPRVNFGGVKKGSAPSQTVKVKTEPEFQVKIVDVVSRSDQVEVVVEDGVGGDAAKIVTVSLKDSLPVGNFKSRVVVKTTSKENPVVNVPVFARIEGDLRLDPPDASFGLLEGPLREPVSRSLKLTNFADQPVKIQSLESSNSALEVSFEEVKKGRIYNVVVTVAKGTAGPLRGKVKLKTDHPDLDQETLTFQVYGIISRKAS